MVRGHGHHYDRIFGTPALRHRSSLRARGHLHEGPPLHHLLPGGHPPGRAALHDPHHQQVTGGVQERARVARKHRRHRSAPRCGAHRSGIKARPQASHRLRRTPAPGRRAGSGQPARPAHLVPAPPTARAGRGGPARPGVAGHPSAGSRECADGLPDLTSTAAPGEEHRRAGGGAPWARYIVTRHRRLRGDGGDTLPIHGAF